MSSGASATDPSDHLIASTRSGSGSTVAAVVPLVPVWRVDKTFDYAVPQALSARIAPGSLVRVPFGHRVVRGVVTALSAGETSELQPIKTVGFPVPVAPGEHIALLEWLARRYVVPRGRAFATAVPPRVRVQVGEPAPIAVPGPAPNRLRAYERGVDLLTAIGAGSAATWLLRACPGEDHGSLIAELVGACGRAAKAAVIAVPEVRYGSLVLDELQRLWPDLARVDSTLSGRDRSAATALLGAGHGLGGGGRGAVLAPVPSLGLIVVDEEHHPTFKEDRAPRFDARLVARERARLQGAVCVLVSATPLVETGAAASSGAIKSAEPRRAEERRARPIVELFETPGDRVLSHALHERVRDTLADGRRVALLAPRRGYARSLWCADCRRSLRCPVCESGLFYDRGPRRVRCPRCGYTGEPPGSCPSCGASAWRFVGAGSERLEEQIKAAFPRTQVRRVDPDVLEGVGEEVGVLDLEGAGIYVTTWIGTKAALRPDVALVGVLDADALIRRADFRAAERAYQAFAEMSEWAGPAEHGGRLVLQTSEPRHHSVQAIARADYRYFLERELELRKELFYPPFSELVKIAATGADAGAVIDAAARACRRAGARVLGPVEGGHGLEILAKCRRAADVADDLRRIASGAPSGTRLRIDVDPR